MFDAHDLAVKIAFGDDDDVLGHTLDETDGRRTDYMLNCARDRTFFVTATSLVGMSQINVEAGDHIFIVSGNSHPVILRPSQKYADTWHAVGECYLHAFMDGAGVRNINICSKFRDFIYQDPAIKGMKGTARNPRLDEIDEEPGEGWQWLLIE
jgi:hypothetical protein